MVEIFTWKFWHDQWEIVASAPWLIIPSLLIAGLVGWKWKGINDDGEMRGLRAELSATNQRLELAREKYDGVVSQLNELKNEIVRQDEMIAAISRAPTAFRVSELATNNREITKALTELSTNTGILGVALRASPRSTNGSE